MSTPRVTNEELHAIRSRAFMDANMARKVPLLAADLLDARSELEKRDALLVKVVQAALKAAADKCLVHAPEYGLLAEEIRDIDQALILEAARGG